MVADASMTNVATDELVVMISSILHRNGTDMEITTLIATVYSADPNARALMKTAGGAKRWLDQHPSAFQLFRPQPDEQPLVWSVRLMAPVHKVASVSEVEVILEKPHKDSSLGILLSGEGHPYIDEVASGALAHGKLRKGDQVLLVNGWDAAGHSQTAKRLVQLAGKIQIRVLRSSVTRSGASYGLRQHLEGARLIGNNDSSRSGAFSMAQLEDALELYLEETMSSKTQLRSEARGLGLNLETGKTYGSAQRLSAALRSGHAPRAKLKEAKQFPLVKACLVLI
jgi:hypothetical protein